MRAPDTIAKIEGLLDVNRDFCYSSRSPAEQGCDQPVRSKAASTALPAAAKRCSAAGAYEVDGVKGASRFAAELISGSQGSSQA